MPYRHLILVVIVCLAWGFNFIAAAKAVEVFPPFFFTALRMLLMLLILFPFLKKPAHGQWGRLLLVCMSMGGLHFGFNFWALQQSTDVSSVAIALQTYVPMSVILAIALLGERAGWRSLSAVSISFIGLMVLGFDPEVLKQPVALMLSLISAFFLALGSTLMRDLKGLSPFAFQGWTAVISLPILAIISIGTEYREWPEVLEANWLHWGGIVYSALIASVIGHGLFFWLVQRHPVSQVTPYLLLTPLFAVFFGITIWGDDPGIRVFVGGALILFGIFIISLRARARAQA